MSIKDELLSLALCIYVHVSILNMKYFEIYMWYSSFIFAKVLHIPGSDYPSTWNVMSRFYYSNPTSSNWELCEIKIIVYNVYHYSSSLIFLLPHHSSLDLEILDSVFFCQCEVNYHISGDAMHPNICFPFIHRPVCLFKEDILPSGYKKPFNTTMQCCIFSFSSLLHNFY